MKAKSNFRLDSSQELKLDANETIFFNRELASIETKFFEFVKEELLYRVLFPIDSSDNPGAESYIYQMFDSVGMAEFIANIGQDLPNVHVFAKEFASPFKSLGLKASWTRQEVRAAQFANKPLQTLKINALRQGFRMKEAETGWDGDPQLGIPGLLNNTNIPVLTAPNGAAASPLFSLKTADEIIKDFSTGTSQVMENSKNVFQADTIAMPLSQYNLIKDLRVPDTGKTVLSYLMDNKFGISQIVPIPTKLTNAFNNGTEDGMFIYKRSEDVLALKIPMEAELLPPEVKGLELITNAESRFGGVVVRYPIACLFFKNI